jgi:hypothetical protein
MVLVGGMAQRTRNGRRLTVAMMTREEEQFRAACVGGGGPRPRGNWAWVWWGGESVMGTVPLPREL